MGAEQSISRIKRKGTAASPTIFKRVQSRGSVIICDKAGRSTLDRTPKYNSGDESPPQKIPLRRSSQILVSNHNNEFKERMSVVNELPFRRAGKIQTKNPQETLTQNLTIQPQNNLRNPKRRASASLITSSTGTIIHLNVATSPKNKQNEILSFDSSPKNISILPKNIQKIKKTVPKIPILHLELINSVSSHEKQSGIIKHKAVSTLELPKFNEIIEKIPSSKKSEQRRSKVMLPKDLINRMST